MLTTPSRRVATSVAALALLLPTAGCGRDEPLPTPLAQPSPTARATLATPTAPEPDASAAAPIAAYRAWIAALADRDATAACARQAPQLTIDLRFEAILLDRARLGDPCVDFVAVQWEQPEREYDILDIEATQVTDEDALLAVDFTGEDQTVRMVRLDTRWFVEETTPRTDSSPTTSGAAPQRWLAAWCDLELGMDAAELTDLMGPPSGAYTIANGGEPQLYWALDQYDFRAYLDADAPSGRAVDLVGDYDRLSESQRSTLDCPELR